MRATVGFRIGFVRQLQELDGLSIDYPGNPLQRIGELVRMPRQAIEVVPQIDLAVAGPAHTPMLIQDGLAIHPANPAVAEAKVHLVMRAVSEIEGGETMRPDRLRRLAISIGENSIGDLPSALRDRADPDILVVPRIKRLLDVQPDSELLSDYSIDHARRTDTRSQPSRA
jgi:hypothetical protein